MPSVMTPSNIQSAMSVPHVNLGIKFCPTREVSLVNMGDYLSMKEVFAIGWSELATKSQIAEKQWSTITQQVKEALVKAAAI